MIWIPDKYHIELTNACVAKCPFCARTMNNWVPRHQELTLKDIKTFFTPEIIKHTKYITFCWIYGDPIYARDFLEIMKYFDEYGLYTSVSTNGYNNKLWFWEDLGSIKNLRITFGIDGITQKTHSAYRVWTNLKQVLKNASKYINTWGNALWQFLVFWNNEHEVMKAREISISLWFKDFIIRKSRSYNENLPKPRMNFTQDGEKVANNGLGIECEYSQKKEWYISSSGQVLPCCYLVNNEYHDESLLDPWMNIKNNSLGDIVKNWVWKKNIWTYINDYGENICIKKCSKTGTTQRYAMNKKVSF